MFKEYSAQSIFIIYEENDSKYIKWAKSFWLLKSAHPIVMIKAKKILSFETDPLNWLKNTLETTSFKPGLYVPIKLKPLLDIDLKTDTNQSNRYGLTRQKLPVICLLDTHASHFEKVDIGDIFEDYTCNTLDDLIDEEISFMKEKLLMGMD